MPELIEYRAIGDGSYLTRTHDGFVISIESPANEVGKRKILVWPADYPMASLMGLRASLESCKTRALELLAEWRAVKAHFMELGRAEVRAAQGELAKTWGIE